jgi:hypothetical protein
MLAMMGSSTQNSEKYALIMNDACQGPHAFALDLQSSPVFFREPVVLDGVDIVQCRCSWGYDIDKALDLGYAGKSVVVIAFWGLEKS